MKIRPVGAELFRADRHTDGHNEEMGRFSQFCEPASLNPAELRNIMCNSHCIPTQTDKLVCKFLFLNFTKEQFFQNSLHYEGIQPVRYTACKVYSL